MTQLPQQMLHWSRFAKYGKWQAERSPVVSQAATTIGAVEGPRDLASPGAMTNSPGTTGS